MRLALPRLPTLSPALVPGLRVGLGVAVALGALGGGGWVLWTSDVLRFHQLRVVGNERVSEAAVRHLADLPDGAPLVALDLDRAVAQVEQHPWVQHVEARRVFPDTVVIQVREREVKAVLVLDGFYLVDADGVPFRRADAGDLHYPLLTGIPRDLAEREPAVARRLIREALGLLEGAEGHGGLRADSVSEVRFSAMTGYALALRNGGEVLLGFDGPANLSRLDALAAAGVDLSLPSRIDLALSQMAVVTPLSI